MRGDRDAEDVRDEEGLGAMGHVASSGVLVQVQFHRKSKGEHDVMLLDMRPREVVPSAQPS